MTVGLDAESSCEMQASNCFLIASELAKELKEIKLSMIIKIFFFISTLRFFIGTYF
jgi:hypothetical protein